MEIKESAWGMRRRWPLVVGSALLAVALGWQLGSVPGLMGDEGSEGENVYELLAREGVTVTGERSYIGPFIDYVRVPFVAWLGYTPLALRLPMWLAALMTAFLLLTVLQRFFGRTVGLYGAVGLLFSPIFLLFNRLGWAVTLFPFWAVLLTWLASSKISYKWLWWGVVAGLGLANHILFLPTLVGVTVGMVVYGALQHKLYRREGWRVAREQGRWALIYGLVAAVGFWAGFGMQFAVLQLQQDDQGDPEQTVALTSERWQLVPEAAPLYVSGSSYIARYTGVEMAPGVQLVITWVVLGLIVVGSLLLWRRPAWWALLAGSGAQLWLMVVMIDRFTLRYFLMPTLVVWLLAGLGLGAVVDRLLKKRMVVQMGAVGMAGLLVAWLAIAVLIPFNQTGGSVADFSLGGARTNSADALVDVRPLVACLRGAGPVWSENVHIWNRLQFLSHEYVDLVVVPEKQKSLAEWEVHYRKEGSPGDLTPGDFCPELAHFRVVRR